MKFKRGGSRFVSIYAQDGDIQYDSTWSGSNVSDEPVMNTVSPHGNSTATYSFHGIAVYLYGYVGPADDQAAPSIACYVDGNLTTGSGPFTLPGVDEGYQQWTSIQLCAQEQLDASNNHTVKVVVTHATEQYPFMLDQFMFRLSSQQYAALNAELIGGGTSTVSSPSAAQSDTAATSAPSTGDASSSKGIPTAAIVGGVLGAIIGLGLTALGIYLVIRRRKQSYAKLVDRDLHPSDTEKITPFHSHARQLSTRSFILRADSTPPKSDGLEEAELASTTAATFNPPPSPPQESTRIPQTSKQGAAGLLQKALRRTSRRPGTSAVPEEPSDLPQDAPPSYSAAAA
ncbi:hypothetical protein C2E23DRAFT_888199 [Lenzites betulinus]|nr:hypothetical protein C2E23DRAFT_888199 [Lenzites betulinus]